jgi:tRNA (guanine37-N1)-methyltransferase
MTSPETAPAAPRMTFQILTLFPAMVTTACQSSLIGKAVDKGILRIAAINIRDFTHDKHLKVDDTPYGGGAGMVLMCQPVDTALASTQPWTPRTKVAMMSPAGRRFQQPDAVAWARDYDQIILLCGHYEGFDERILTLYPEIDEVSIGDFVLTGGELPALCLLDSISRFVPGVVKEVASVQNDSFMDTLLDHPHYTRPSVYKDLPVPDVLLSGNHQAIDTWRLQQRQARTQTRRPDLLHDPR